MNSYKGVPYAIHYDGQGKKSIELREDQLVALELAGADTILLDDIGSQNPASVMEKFIRSIPVPGDSAE